MVGGVEVARHENTPAVTEGTHTFFADISSYPDGPLEILVRAEPRGLFDEPPTWLGGDDRITVTIDRTQPKDQ